jgi:hypothetical protein
MYASFSVQRHTAAGGRRECSVAPVDTTTRCESCGRDEPAADVLDVHRAYLTPAAWDAEERIDVEAGTERWCASCRATYPHQFPGADEPEL